MASPRDCAFHRRRQCPSEGGLVVRVAEGVKVFVRQRPGVVELVLGVDGDGGGDLPTDDNRLADAVGRKYGLTPRQVR